MAIPPLFVVGAGVAAAYGAKKLYEWVTNDNERETAQGQIKPPAHQPAQTTPQPQRHTSQNQPKPQRQKEQNMGNSKAYKKMVAQNRYLEERLDDMRDELNSERERHEEEMNEMRNEMYDLREEMKEERKQHREEMMQRDQRIKDLYGQMTQMSEQHAQTILQMQAKFEQDLAETVAQVRLSEQASAREFANARAKLEGWERDMLAWVEAVAGEIDAQIGKVILKQIGAGDGANSNLGELGGEVGELNPALAQAAREQMAEIVNAVAAGFAPQFERARRGFASAITAGLSLTNAPLAQILQGENGAEKERALREFLRELQEAALGEFYGEVGAALDGVLAGARERFAGRLEAQRAAIAARERSLGELKNATNVDEKAALHCAAGYQLARYEAALAALAL